MPTPELQPAIARRPFVKRRPYQPKPKPGEAKRPAQPFVPRDSSTPRPHQNFKTAPHDRPAAPVSSQFRSPHRHKAVPEFSSRPSRASRISNRAPPQRAADPDRSRRSPNHTTQNRAARGSPARRSEGKAPAAQNRITAESHSENSAPTPSNAPSKSRITIAQSSRNPKLHGAAPNHHRQAGARTQAQARNSAAARQPAAAANPALPGNRASPRNPAHSAAPKANSQNQADVPPGMKPRHRRTKTQRQRPRTSQTKTGKFLRAEGKTLRLPEE